jgi:xanthine dehydrogenase/oxidase
MNVTLVQGARNDREGNIFSSKGVGEASMACGTCPFFAVRDAITAARLDSGMDSKQATEFVLDSPATPERVRLCCGDKYVKLAAGLSTRPVASL